MMMQQILAAVVLALVLLIFTVGKSPVFRIDRAGAAIIGAVVLVASGVLSLEEAAAAIDSRTIVVLFSMMVVVATLKLAGFFDVLGYWVVLHIQQKKTLLLTIILFGGFLSAVAINDIVCLLFTPVVLLICRQGDCAPLPHVLGLAMASNIGSAMTLMGNPQNILIGSLGSLAFGAYFFTALPVTILGLMLTYGLLFWRYQKDLTGCLQYTAIKPKKVHPYLLGKALTVLFLIIFARFCGVDLAIAASLGAAFLLFTRRVKPNKIYHSIDFNLLVIFIGLFVLIAGVEKSGLMQQLIAVIPPIGQQSLAVFSVLTLLLSNLVSNVPAVLLLRYLVPTDDALLWWQALALFSTLAGNLTVFGSIANLIVVEMAKKEGIKVSASAYLQIGFPLTIMTCLIAFMWLEVF